MIKKSVFLFVACACPLFPALSRFFFGIVFALAFCLSFFALLGAKKLISLCSLKREFAAAACEILSLFLCASLYSALVRLIFPIAYSALEFFLYAVPFISLLFDSLSAKTGAPSALSAQVLTAAIFPTAFSLLRELLYFGTVSFPASGEIHSFAVFSPEIASFTRFFGSLPGSLALTGLILWMWNCATAKRPPLH